MRGLIAIALLAACTSESVEVYDYDCHLVRSCGEQGDATTFPITGDVDDVETFANEWTAACQQLTRADVGRCSFVVCAAICFPR